MSQANGTDELKFTTLQRRVIGEVIDSLVVAVVIVLGFMTGFMELAILSIVISIFYIIFLEGIWTNQTLGKYLLNMKIVKADGSDVKIRHSVARNLVGIIGDQLAPIGWIAAILAITKSSKNQRVGDKVAGTVVVDL